MKRASLRSFGLASLFIVGTTMAACGSGTDTTGLFASGGQGSGASGGAGPGGAGPGGAGPGGAGGQGGAGQGGAAQSSSSASSSSAQSASSSSAQSSSSGPMPPVVMITCGDVVCPVEGQSACCWDEYEYNDPPRGECVSGPDDNDGCATDFGGNGAPGFETRIECQLPEHCAEGTVCCADLNQTQNGNWYSLLRCATTCEYPAQRVLCDPQAPDNACPVIMTGNGPVQTTCQPSSILPDGFTICRN